MSARMLFLFYLMISINFATTNAEYNNYDDLVISDNLDEKTDDITDDKTYDKTYLNSFNKIYYSPPLPIVLLHGITSDTSELINVVNWLQQKLPNKVFNIEIGNGKFNSIFKTMDWQLDQLCMTIYNIPELENGFHFIGMSQGGLLARGYVQRCNRFPVRNLITWVSPQAGVYGFNEVYFDWSKVYSPFYQTIYSFAGYWKDPFQYDVYLANATFLPYLNNESPRLEQYAAHGFDFYKNKERIESLDNFVMIWSGNDDVISPPQSGRFEFYDIVCNKRKTPQCQEKINELVEKYFDKADPLPVQDFFSSQQFSNNLLGLRTLYETKRLHMLETNCTHSGHKTPLCFPQLEDLTFQFLI
jgi:palmitoyl-protein thioesterase